MKIVHIMIFEKFIRSYIEFLDEHFNIDEHRFFIIGKDYGKYNLDGLPQTKIVNTISSVIGLNTALYTADKIILHGLWNPKVIRLLNLQPWLIKKCYWMMWGGDFYNYENEGRAKKRLIKKLRHFISLFKGDFELVKEKYHTSGTLHECIAYPGQLFENTALSAGNNHSQTTCILVGNSADHGNNHTEALQIIKDKIKQDEDIKIICPLSYGSDYTANHVEQLGIKLFANKFIALRKFIPFEDYNQLLNTVDIAVFNHKRQQAVGNVTSMLAKGKKVYLHPANVLFNYFYALDIQVFDINKFNLERMEEQVRNRNIEQMKKHFSTEVYIQQLKNLFYH